MEECCGNCRFQRNGECHKAFPTYRETGQQWALIMLSDWCGEWQPMRMIQLNEDEKTAHLRGKIAGLEVAIAEKDETIATLTSLNDTADKEIVRLRSENRKQEDMVKAMRAAHNIQSRGE